MIVSTNLVFGTAVKYEYQEPFKLYFIYILYYNHYIHSHLVFIMSTQTFSKKRDLSVRRNQKRTAIDHNKKSNVEFFDISKLPLDSVFRQCNIGGCLI